MKKGHVHVPVTSQVRQWYPRLSYVLADLMVKDETYAAAHLREYMLGRAPGDYLLAAFRLRHSTVGWVERRCYRANKTGRNARTMRLMSGAITK